MSTDQKPLSERLRTLSTFFRQHGHVSEAVPHELDDIADALDKAPTAVEPAPVARIAEDVAGIRSQLRELAVSLPTREVVVHNAMHLRGGAKDLAEALGRRLPRKLPSRPSVLADQSEEIAHLRKRLVESEGFKARSELEDLAHDLGIRGSGKLSDADLLAEIRKAIFATPRNLDVVVRRVAGRLGVQLAAGEHPFVISGRLLDRIGQLENEAPALASDRNRQIESIAAEVGVKEPASMEVDGLLEQIGTKISDLRHEAGKVRRLAIERDSARSHVDALQRNVDEIFGLLLSVSSVEERGYEAAGLRSLIERCHGLQKIADGLTYDLAKMKADRDALAEANARGSATLAMVKADRDVVAAARDAARLERDEGTQALERLDNANARLRSDLAMTISARDAAQARLAEREDLERKAFFGDLDARELEQDLAKARADLKGWREWATDLLQPLWAAGLRFPGSDEPLAATVRQQISDLVGERVTLQQQLAAVTSAPMAVALRDTIEGLRAIGAVLGDDIRGESGLEAGQRLAARVRTLDSVWAGILGTFGLDPKADPRGVVELVRNTAQEREHFQAALEYLGMTGADSERPMEWARAQVSRRGACQSISRRELERTFVAAGGVSPADPSSEQMADHIIARLVELKEANDKLARWDRDAAADVLSSVRRVLGCGDGDDVVAIAGARCRRISDQYNRISDLEAALSWWRNDFASRFVPGTVLPLEGSHVATLRFQAL